MFLDRQNILEILQYLCSAGLILSSAAVFIMRDVKKKVVSLFFVFVFITILSFIFYAGIMLFIVAFIFVFVFLVLYLLASGISRTAGADLPWKDRKVFTLKTIKAAIAVLFCLWLGYVINDASAGYFQDIDRGNETYITGLEEISEPLFTTYGIVVIIIIAAIFITFLGITIFYGVKQKDGGGEGSGY